MIRIGKGTKKGKKVGQVPVTIERLKEHSVNLRFLKHATGSTCGPKLIIIEGVRTNYDLYL